MDSSFETLALYCTCHSPSIHDEAAIRLVHIIIWKLWIESISDSFKIKSIMLINFVKKIVMGQQWMTWIKTSWAEFVLSNEHDKRNWSHQRRGIATDVWSLGLCVHYWEVTRSQTLLRGPWKQNKVCLPLRLWWDNMQCMPYKGSCRIKGTGCVPRKSIWLATARAWTCPLQPSKDSSVAMRAFH